MCGNDFLNNENHNDKEIIKIEQLTPESREVNILVKVVSKNVPISVTSKKDKSQHKVSDVLVADETGCIYLTIWDENISEINEGIVLRLENGFISLFKGSMHLNIGRFGKIEILAGSKIKTINLTNNLSNKIY